MKKQLILATVLASTLTACGSVQSLNPFKGDGSPTAFKSIYEDTFSPRDSQQRGIIVNGAHDPRLKLVKIGTSKRAVLSQTAWGKDHYSAGFGANELNYIFAYPNGDGSFSHCQAKLTFDERNTVNRILDNPVGCLAQVEREVPKEIVEKVERHDPQVQRVEIKATELFDFDKAILKSEAIPELQQLASFARSMNNIERLIVVGHTDKSGSDEYNQRLSEARARAVGNWLVSYGGLPANIIHIVGMGEREPIKDCGNPDRPSPATKACNEANRRVEVFLEGSKMSQ